MLGSSEALDVFLDSLECLGGQLGLNSEDRVFRFKFTEGLPSALHAGAVSRKTTYSGDYAINMARLRDRVVVKPSVQV